MGLGVRDPIQGYLDPGGVRVLGPSTCLLAYLDLQRGAPWLKLACEKDSNVNTSYNL